MMEEDGMRLARIRPPKNDEVSLLDLTVGARAAACSENRRQTGDAGSVSSAIATVDVVASHHHAGEFLG